MKLSVIVPIYKVERYLKRCIDSIVNQTYENLEIILVDDESPDNCGRICDEYALKDNRIKVIHKENGGLSDARNAGLDIATGEYIAFVDSDDWIEADFCEYLMNSVDKYAVKMAVGGVKVYDELYQKYRKEYDVHNEEVLKKEEFIKKVFLSTWAAWDKIYHKSLFDSIRFPKGEFNEDEAIMLQLIDQCEYVFVSNKAVYVHYVRESESITASRFSIKKLDWYYHCKANVEFVMENYPELTEYAEKRYISSIVWGLNNMTVDTKKFKKEIKFLRSDLRKHLYIQGEVKEKVRGVLLAYFYYLYAIVVKIMGKHYT